MNQNTAYELFTREIYQLLVNIDTVRTVQVQHNVKLEGRSGQKHQIDVYWEYEIAGNKHRVAIECKNYSNLVPISKVRDFKGVLDDLNDVNGIMVTKIGYQEGAKKYAQEYGISLKELRSPEYGESVLGQIDIVMRLDMRHTLFQVDEKWAAENGFNLVGYRQFLNSSRLKNDEKWANATHIPFQVKDGVICDSKGNSITSLRKLEEQLHDDNQGGDPVTFTFENAFVNVCGVGLVKIKEVRFEYESKVEERRIALDARGFVMAILKDAINGSVQFI